jgi:Lrp/AsnC family transcriptional regulator, regulator for asnA, asnC and gidA
MRNEGGERKLDGIDRALVAQLQRDGRRPYRVIARSLGISEGTVRWRVQRLQEEGSLHIAAIADPFRLGYKVQAFMLLRVDAGELDVVVEALDAWPEVVYVSSCTGRADLYVQVVCRDHEDLWELLARRIPAIGGVVGSETLMELKVHKFRYIYGDGGDGTDSDPAIRAGTGA